MMIIMDIVVILVVALVVKMEEFMRNKNQYGGISPGSGNIQGEPRGYGDGYGLKDGGGYKDGRGYSYGCGKNHTEGYDDCTGSSEGHTGYQYSGRGLGYGDSPGAGKISGCDFGDDGWGAGHQNGSGIDYHRAIL